MNKGGACGEREFRGRGGNFCAPFSKRVACQVSLNKNHIGWGGIEGIHPAILMNCAAQAFLNAALVSSL